MRSFLVYLPVWTFSLGALWIGAAHAYQPTSNLYVGLGGLGVCIASALMAHNKCLRDLENRLKVLERKFDIR